MVIQKPIDLLLLQCRILSVQHNVDAISIVPGALLDGVHNLCEMLVHDIQNHNSDRIGSRHRQPARKQIRPVAILLRSLPDSGFCGITDPSRIIQRTDHRCS